MARYSFTSSSFKINEYARGLVAFSVHILIERGLVIEYVSLDSHISWKTKKNIFECHGYLLLKIRINPVFFSV